MRLLTLVLALAVAGLLLILPQQFKIDLLPAFLRLWPNTEGQRQLANLIFFAVPVTAVAGGILALFVPGISALLLLLAGLGWFGIVFSIPQGFSLPAAAPGGVAVLAAVSAYIAAEIAASRRREEMRAELREARASRRSRRLGDYEDDEAEDVDDEYEDPFERERDREPAITAPPRREPAAEKPAKPQAPKRPRYEIPLTLEDSASRDADEAEVEIDEPEITPPRRGVVEPVATVRTPPPAPRRSARPASHARDMAVTAAGRTPYEDDAPSARGTFMRWFAIGNVVAVLLLGLAIGWLVLDRGESRPAAGTATSLAQPAGTQPGGTTGETYSDPFRYCKAVGTVDYVDARYTGEMVPPIIAEALRMPRQSSRDRVTWRCYEGTLVGCSSFAWPRCGMVPTADELVAFCRNFPDVPRLIAPQGPWACEAGKPKLPDDASWPVDPRGFAAGAWLAIEQAAPAGGDAGSAALPNP